MLGLSSKANLTISAFASPAAKMMATASGLLVMVCRPMVMTGRWRDTSMPPRSPAAAAAVLAAAEPVFPRDLETAILSRLRMLPPEAWAEIPGAENVSVGDRVYLQAPNGMPIPVRVAAKDETAITFDANHEMAGKELNFTIELVEVLE